MAKLKAFEIDAIFNKLHSQVEEIKEAKLNEIKKNIKLSKKALELLDTIEKYNEAQKYQNELYNKGSNLAKEIFGLKGGYHYGWNSTTKEELINFEAKKHLPEKLRDTIGDLRTRIIIANIDGNVQELMDNILEEYND